MTRDGKRAPLRTREKPSQRFNAFRGIHMFDTQLRHFIAICCLAVLPVGAAQAAAVYYGNTAASNGYSPPVQDVGTSAIPLIYNATGSGGSATSVSDSANGGSVDAQASAAGYNPLVPVSNGANARTTLTYRIDIVSLVPMPPPGMIPIRIVANGLVSGADLGPSAFNYAYVDASAQFLVSTNNNDMVVVNQEIETKSYVTDTFHFDQVLDFLPTDYLTVILDAGAEASSIGNDPGSAHAFVDPTFTIDPAYAAFYELVGIPGEDAVGTPPDTGPGGSSNGVPEPSSVWLLFLGVAMLGVVGRQQSHVGRLASLLRRAARPFDRSGHAERRTLVGWS